MKNLAFALAITLFLAACSSGSTVAPVASAVSSTFTGTYASGDGSDTGSVTFDLVQADTNVTGNIIISSNGASCLRDTTVAGGTNNGFNLSINADLSVTGADSFQIETTTTTTAADGTSTSTVSTVISSSGTVGTVTNNLASNVVQTVVTTLIAGETLSGLINIELAISNNGNTLSGTYVTSGEACAAFPSSGEMSLTRS